MPQGFHQRELIQRSATPPKVEGEEPGPCGVNDQDDHEDELRQASGPTRGAL